MAVRSLTWYVVLAALVAILTLAARPHGHEPGFERFPLPAFHAPASQVADAAERFGWTQFADYRTIRLDEIERPAQLVASPRRVMRRLQIPPEGGRYELHVAGVEAPLEVQVRVGSAPPRHIMADAGMWRRVSVPLDPGNGRIQTAMVTLSGPPGALAVWGQEKVLPAARAMARPDVFLISLDTVRRDQLTPYNPGVPVTARLAEFARESIRFDEAISTSSWTVAAHATLFTGRYPADSLGYGSRVEPEEVTLAERFAAAGYRTFGLSGGPYTEPRWGLHQGFDAYVVAAERENAGRATDLARRWLHGVGEAPVFMFLNYFNAHEPLELSPEVQRYTGVTEGVSLTEWHQLDSGSLPITESVRARLLRAYRAQLTAVDAELAVFFDALERMGRWENAIVIVWSDHGQLLGERGFIGHAFTLDEELIRVPLMIKPNRGAPLNPGVYPWLFQNDDLFALIQELAGLDAGRPRIVADVEAGRSVRSHAFAKIHHDPLPELVAARRWRSPTVWAARDLTSKLVRELDGSTYAYDVTAHGLEQPIDLVRAASLLNALDRFISWSHRPDPQRTVGPLQPDELQRLRSLGYVQ